MQKQVIALAVATVLLVFVVINGISPNLLGVVIPILGAALERVIGLFVSCWRVLLLVMALHAGILLASRGRWEWQCALGAVCFVGIYFFTGHPVMQGEPGLWGKILHPVETIQRLMDFVYAILAWLFQLYYLLLVLVPRELRSWFSGLTVSLLTFVMAVGLPVLVPGDTLETVVTGTAVLFVGLVLGFLVPMTVNALEVLLMPRVAAKKEGA